MKIKALFLSILATLDIISLLVLMMTENIILMAVTWSITFVIMFYVMFKSMFELENSDNNK